MTKPTLKDMAVRLRNDSPIGNQATITINNQVIPVLEAVVRIRPDDLVTIEATVIAKDIDVQAIQEKTRITLVDKT